MGETNLAIGTEGTLVAISTGSQGVVFWRVSSYAGFIVPALDHVVTVGIAPPIPRHGIQQIATQALALGGVHAFLAQRRCGGGEQ